MDASDTAVGAAISKNLHSLSHSTLINLIQWRRDI
jgi:hypothetical protein